MRCQISLFNNFGQFTTYPAVSSYGQISSQTGQLSTGNYYQSFQPQLQNIGQQTNITFVNGIEGAKAYQLSSNSSALLMDFDNSKFYVKTTDSFGIPKVSSYSFVEDENFNNQNQEPQNTVKTDQPSKEYFNGILLKISELETKTNELSAKLNEVIYRYKG